MRGIAGSSTIGWALSFLVLPIGFAAAAPLAILDATKRCAPGSACIDFAVDISDWDAREVKAPFRGRAPQCGVNVIKIKGRLGRGPIRRRAVAIEADCMPCSAGWVRYFGRSAANNPIIGTASGRFEVIDDGVAIGAIDDLRVIDRTTNGLVATYVGAYGASDGFYFVGGKVYMKQPDGACFVASKAVPGPLVRAPAKCAKPEGIGEGFMSFSEAKPATQALIKTFVRPDAYDVVWLRPIAGTKLLALQVGDNCRQ